MRYKINEKVERKIQKKKLKNTIESTLKRKKLKLKEQLPDGFVKELQLKTGLKKSMINNAISRLRRKQNIKLRNPKSKRKVENKLFNSFKDLGFNRGMPAQERKICYEIEDVLRSLPFGGTGLIIGTATPISAKPGSIQWGGKLFYDNLIVAHTIDRTTENMTINVGNGIDKKKAEEKVKHWNMCLPHISCISERIDKFSFYAQISHLAETNDIVKVVLLTSGVWDTKRKKNGIDLNFKEATKALLSKYDNIYILAMVSKGRFRFQLKKEASNKLKKNLK